MDTKSTDCAGACCYNALKDQCEQPDCPCHTLLSSLEREIHSEWKALETPDLFGLNIIFVARDDDDCQISRYAPLVSNVEELIQSRRDLIVNDPQALAVALHVWMRRGMMEVPEGHDWIPLAVKVVKLAAIPF